MKAALVCAFLAPLPALADGPALAHLSLGGTTITLTKLAPIHPDEPMAFAQMHLRFPLPPILHLTVIGTELQHISLNTPADDLSTGMGTPLGPDTYLMFEPDTASVTRGNDTLRVDVQAMTRTGLGQWTPRIVTVEVALTSP